MGFTPLCNALFATKGLFPNIPDIFLSNGARFYLDIGKHPEYSTPEARDLDDLVYAVAAGHRIIDDAANNAEVKYRSDGKDVRIKVFAYNWHRNNIEILIESALNVGLEQTVGTHENYLLSRSVPFKTLVSILLPFFSTRVIYSGSGLVLPEQYGRFEISSRAGFIQENVSFSTETSRGICNTRDEPHADKKRFRRSHVIVGESLMSDFQKKLTYGTTRLVYALIELISQSGNNPLKEVCGLRDPVGTLQQISKDLTLTQEVCDYGKNRHTAIRTNRQYFEAVSSNTYLDTIRQMVGSYDFDWTVYHWDRVLSSLEKDPMSLHKELDWVIKLSNFQEMISSKGSKWDEMAPKLHQAYHRVHPENQLFEGLVKMGKVMVLHPDRKHRIQQAMDNPPNGTRAEARVRIMKELLEGGIYFDADWSTINMINQSRVMMPDPRIPNVDYYPPTVLHKSQ